MLEALAACVAGVALAVAAWRGARPLAVPAAAGAGAVSLAVSALALLGEDRTGGALPALEALALIGLVFLALRRAPPRQGAIAAAVAGCAAAAIVPAHAERSSSAAATVAGIAAWGAGVGLAVAAAGYLNALDARRARSVAEARREQRLSLARDLHDFVAQDVSAIVVQAQAARMVGEREPRRALATLEQIERAGLHALAAMDRAVAALRDAAPAGDGERHDLDGLRELAARFEAAGAARVELDVEAGAAAAAPAGVHAAAYRVVAEGLTNVRRHAGGATRVRVAVGTAPLRGAPALAVAVVDDGDADGPALGPEGRTGGSGIPALRERVEALGGTLEAGPERPAGWRLAALLPLGEGR